MNTEPIIAIRSVHRFVVRCNEPKSSRPAKPAIIPGRRIKNGELQDPYLEEFFP